MLLLTECDSKGFGGRRSVSLSSASASGTISTGEGCECDWVRPPDRPGSLTAPKLDPRTGLVTGAIEGIVANVVRLPCPCPLLLSERVELLMDGVKEYP